MHEARIFLVSLVCLTFIVIPDTEAERTPDNKTVMIVLLVSNKGHILSPFLNSLRNLKHPKKLIDLYIRSDHSEDSTYFILEHWLSENGHEYNSVDKILKFGEVMYPDESEDDRWSTMRSIELIELKEEALMKARELERDYVWFLDVDVFFRDPDILKKLMQEGKTLIAPKLDSVDKFSNFWGDMTDEYWYKRSADYFDIIDNKKEGCFPVALINSCVLVNLQDEKSKALSFMRHRITHLSSTLIPRNDAIIFALSAKFNGIDQYVCNNENYGAILLAGQHNIEREFQQLKVLDIINVHQTTNKNINIAQLSKQDLSSKINSAFDKMYCINLKRRQDRREDMESKFQKLGLEVSFFEAVDWRSFNASFLSNLELRQLRAYDGGDMTYGLAGNFLSHYFIWEDVINNDFQQILIFEDDVKFYDDSLARTSALLNEIEKLDIEWEILFLGRKIMRSWEESPVSGTDMLVKPSYSYWTLAYMLSYEGARKLLDQKPLQKIIPVDEYLPIMYDMHPEDKWKEHFSPRDLKAFAITPVVCEPNFYLHQDANYTSDTSAAPELSEVLDFENDPRLYTNQNLRFVKTEL